MVWWSDLRGKEQSLEAKGQTRECSDMGAWGQGSGDGCWRHLWQDSGRILAPGLGKPLTRGMEMGKNMTPIYILSLAAQSDMQLGCPSPREALEEVTHSLEDT